MSSIEEAKKELLSLKDRNRFEIMKPAECS